ncbi:MAG TPA: hypothetical protein VHG08_02010 [Longimicrobium sp.]|nr:hypothetical protein [Longimicrobium sp.]
MASQGRRFRRSEGVASTAYRAGHLFWMPAGSTWLNRDKPRPFALATSFSGDALGTLVYGSTQETEKSSGAVFMEVAPALRGLNRNGLTRRTYFYPGMLLPILHERLPAYSGFLGKSLPELRAALRVALGIGRGSCLGPDAPADSCRGRIVAVRSALARDIHATFAVVLTEPGYSAQRNYQIILPVYTRFARKAGTHDLLVSASEWPTIVSAGTDRILLPVPLTQSIWHDDDIARETDGVRGR